MKAVAEVARIECLVFRRARNTPATRVRDLHAFVRLAKVRIMLKRLVASSSSHEVQTRRMNALMRARRLARSAFLRPGWQNLQPMYQPCGSVSFGLTSWQHQECHQERLMSHALSPIRRLGKDEDGAALVEYTVLLGVLLVAVIAVIGSVGAWIGGQWSSLCKALPGATC